MPILQTEIGTNEIGKVTCIKKKNTQKNNKKYPNKQTNKQKTKNNNLKTKSFQRSRSLQKFTVLHQFTGEIERFLRHCSMLTTKNENTNQISQSFPWSQSA